MKIVHVMNWYIPGMGYQENFLPREQERLGHEVIIITSDRIPNYSGFKQHVGKFFSNRIIGGGIYSDNNIKIYRLNCYEYRVLILRRLKEKLRELNPDIVHAHGPFLLSTMQATLYGRELNYTLLIDDHSHETIFYPASYPVKAFNYFSRMFYRYYLDRISYFLPINDSSQRIIQLELGIPLSKIEVLPLGADTRTFKKLDSIREQERFRLGIDNNELLLISAGKFDMYKDIHILLKAFKGISVILPNIKLLLVGNGPIDYMQKLKDYTDKVGIGRKVLFKDFVKNTELPKYYNASDIGIWPGNPSITVIEAIATGLPVIVPIDDHAYKILFENEAAVGFERGNTESLIGIISELVTDAEFRFKLSINSLAITADLLSWEKIAKKSISIYLKALHHDKT